MVFVCFNYFITELTEILEADDTYLPIPESDALTLCEKLEVDPCIGCLPGDDPETSGTHYTRLMIHHSGRYEIVKVIGCDQGVPIIERGEEGTTALRFPVGACVQFVWTCANITDMVAQVSDAVSHALDYDDDTGQLDLLVDGVVVSSVIISGGSGPPSEDMYVNSMTYDKATNTLELGFVDGSTITAIISPYLIGAGYDSGTEVLTLTLSDLSTITTTIPRGLTEDVHLNSASYDNGTRILSLGLTDGSNYDVNLSSLYGLNLAGVNFNSSTNQLTFTMSDSSTFISDLTSLSEHVTGMTFSTITNILTLNREIGSDLTADLSLLAEDTKIQSMTFNPTTRVLTIFSTDGSSDSVTITAPPDIYVSAMTFDNPTRTLTLLMSDASVRTTVIPVS